MTMFKLKPSEVKAQTILCMEAGLVPFVQSSPGIGKSSIIHQIAKEFGLLVIDLRLSQCAPEDLMGLPMRVDRNGVTKATFAPFETFPTADMPIPKGYNGWILFLDEFNSASKSVQAAAYKIVLDRMVGQAQLHPECFIACAGNLATDRAITTTQSTAMQSRLIHLEMICDHKEWMDYAVSQQFDPRVIGFLEFQPGKLHKFDPDHQDRTFPCPRTWEFESRLIKDKPFKAIPQSLSAGAISDGVAVEFHTFMEVYSKLPSFQQILSKPEELPVPTDASTRYAVATMLMDKTKAEHLEDVLKYMKRLSPEFQVIFFRGLVRRDPKIRREKPFVDNIRGLTDFLSDMNDTPAQAA